MKVKSWQIVVIVAGLLVGLGSVAYSIFTSGGPRVKGELVLIDVESGETYTANVRGITLVIPAARPSDGKETLFPLGEENGNWHVPTRYLVNAKDLGVTFKAIDPESGQLLVPMPTPKRYKAPGG